MEGRLRKVYRDLQYGFIQSDKKSYFFHKSSFDGDWSSLCNDFDRGETINLEFKPTTTEKGLRAEEVQFSDV